MTLTNLDHPKWRRTQFYWEPNDFQNIQFLFCWIQILPRQEVSIGATFFTIEFRPLRVLLDIIAEY